MDLMRALRTWTLWAAVGIVVVCPAVASDEGYEAARQVSQTSYIDFMDNWLYTHAGDNRGFGLEHDLARDNIEYLMQSYGLTVALEPFTYNSTTYYNVVGTKTGTVYPAQEYIIGAHFDSVDNPGADDDASGVALVLEAARIITQYPSDYTIRFIAFDREEQGLYGSNAYVNDHIGDDIRAMLQADMVAYDTGTYNALLYSHYSALKASLGAAIVEYSGGLTYTDGGWNGQSDHQPFDAAGFESCLLIEGEVWSNPYYHTQLDSFETLGNLNFPYAVMMTRSAVGWLVDQAAVQVPVNTLDFAYPSGQPEYVDPTGGTVMRVEVYGVGTEVPQPGTGMLHYDTGSGWQSVPMNVVSDNVYDAVFPADTCGDETLYYVSAQAVGGRIYTDPRTAPTVSHWAIAANGLLVYFHDDFETNQGWSAANTSGATSGDWQRGVPVDDPNWEYDPASDSDGSGQCYLTQNQTGNTDVDAGSVMLTSPIIDMSTAGLAVSYDYYLRLTDGDGTDRLLVEANNNGGVGAWTEVARHDTDGGMGWRSHTITEADLIAASVPPTATMQFRFTANDGNPQSIVEGGLDAFLVSRYDCGAPPGDGDYDGNGVVDLYDVSGLQVCFSADGFAYPAGMGCDVFDFEPDGDVDLTDFGVFQTVFTDPG